MPTQPRGARQHYLPAAYIGNFSEDSSPRRRTRPVWVRRRDRSDVFLSRAENLAWARDLYTLRRPTEDPHFVDRLWDHAEQNLNFAIDALRRVPDQPLDAGLWIGVLVNFVTELFVRSPDWERSLADRFIHGLGVDPREELPTIDHADNANMARAFEHQRVSPAVIRADWHILRAPPGAAFISNDVGRAPMLHAATGASGYVVPLALDLALTVLDSGQHLRLVWDDAVWHVEGFYNVELTREDVAGLNQTMWRTCTEAVYGASKSLVRTAASDVRPPPRPVSDGAIALGDLDKRQRMEHLQWQVRELVSQPPPDGQAEWSLGELDGSWTPGVTPRS
jgi:Protein of unknown function (DUF4238)